MTRVRVTSLVLVVAGLAACGGGQTSPPSSGTTQPQVPASASASVPPQLLALLPAEGDVPGWVPSKPPRAFTPDTLFELIDGAANGFVTYGVQAVVAADYARQATGDEAAVEVYQMQDPLNAFGKYSEERGPEYRFLPIGNEGYSDATTVNFWAGQYYVKITAFEEKEEVVRGLIELARAMASRVSVPGAEPPELSWFPSDGQLPHTSKYLPRDVLSQSYFTNGFEVRYRAGARQSRLVLIDMGSPAAAGEALARYRQFVAKGGAVLEDIASPGAGGFAGDDSFHGSMVAVRAGKHVAVALGSTGRAAGRKQVADLVQAIR